MLCTRTKIILFIVILVALWLLHTGFTSADIFAERLIKNNILIATTLDFNSRHPANQFPISSLFNISGIVFDGFDVRAIRIKNEGKMNVKYHVRVKKTGGDTPLCQALTIDAQLKSQSKYHGPLLNLSLDSSLEKTNRDDWIFFISLDTNEAGLKNKICEFDLFFNTYRNQVDDQPLGLHAERTLTNIVTSGNW